MGPTHRDGGGDTHGFDARDDDGGGNFDHTPRDTSKSTPQTNQQSAQMQTPHHEHHGTSDLSLHAAVVPPFQDWTTAEFTAFDDLGMRYENIFSDVHDPVTTSRSPVSDVRHIICCCPPAPDW